MLTEADSFGQSYRQLRLAESPDLMIIVDSAVPLRFKAVLSLVSGQAAKWTLVRRMNRRAKGAAAVARICTPSC